jgi:hypothetical protein
LKSFSEVKSPCDLAHAYDLTRILEMAIDGLKQAMNKISTLRGLLPICAACKKIRDDKGYWNRIETYIMEHSDADFSHGICPDCAKEL